MYPYATPPTRMACACYAWHTSEGMRHTTPPTAPKPSLHNDFDESLPGGGDGRCTRNRSPLRVESTRPEPLAVAWQAELAEDQLVDGVTEEDLGQRVLATRVGEELRHRPVGE